MQANFRMNARGQSMVESMVALFVVSVAVFGSAAIFRTVKNSEKSTQEKYELTLSIGEARAISSALVMGSWIRLGKENCEVDEKQVKYITAFLSGFTGFKVMDKAALEGAMSADLRTQINQVINSSSTNAVAKCGDSVELENAGLDLLAESAFNQGLCRCAAVTTFYETFKSPATDLSARYASFACIHIGSAEAGSEVLFELSAHTTNLLDGKRSQCSELKGAKMSQLLKRVDYTASVKAGAVSQMSGTYYLPISDEKLGATLGGDFGGAVGLPGLSGKLGGKP